MKSIILIFSVKESIDLLIFRNCALLLSTLSLSIMFQVCCTFVGYLVSGVSKDDNYRFKKKHQVF
jgi:uncharacterized membrane protein SpoIIM required for sporulation